MRHQKQLIVAVAVAVVVGGGISCALAACLSIPPFDHPAATVVAPSLDPVPAKPHGLAFDYIVRNIGVIGKPTVVRFPFRNGTARRLGISALTPSCSCATRELKQRVYQPGQTGEIVASVDATAKSPGVHSFSVRVDYDDVELPATYLRIVARVGSDLQLQPTVHVRQIGDEPASATFFLIDFREKHLDVYSVAADDALLHVEPLVIPRTYSAGWHWLYRVTLTGKIRAPGSATSKIRLRTSDPTHPVLETSVLVERLSRIRVAPQTIMLRQATAGNDRALEGRVLIDDRKGSPVVIDSVKCDRPGFCSEFAKAASRVQLLRFSLKPTEKFTQHERITLHVLLSRPVVEDICVNAVCP